MTPDKPTVARRPAQGLLTAVLVLLLAACSHAPVRPGDADPAGNDMLARLASADDGALVELPIGNPLALGGAVPGPVYTAASLRECRRLYATDGQPLGRVICRAERGGWYLQRSLLSAPTEPTAVDAILPVAETAIAPSEGAADNSAVNSVDVNVDDTLQRFPIRAGETLWSFTRRITGNANHWQRIAELNDIDDAAAITAGTELAVPTALVRAGD